MDLSLPVLSPTTTTDRLDVAEPAPYPAAMLNVTNRCNLSCKHCFVYSEGNPNDPADMIGDDALLAELRRVRERHHVHAMLWMGGEPMIRWRLLERGVKLFPRNIITTNGTIPLRDFGVDLTYVVSLDGPEDLNDELRGEGVYAKVMQTLAALPDDFAPTMQIQCVVTRQNQDRLGELVGALRDTKVDGMAFSFHTPSVGEQSKFSFRDVRDREGAIDRVIELKRQNRGFIWNNSRALELMRAPTAKLVTDNCPTLRTVLPLYVEGDRLVTPRCCYGNDADCDRCAGWVVFAHAAKLDGPWDDVLPPSSPHDGLLTQFFAAMNG